MKNRLKNMKETDIDNFDDKELQEEIVEIPTEIRKITTQAYDKSVADLVRMIEDGDINLNPEYQRNYVWDNKKASLLIESIILNVPIPVVYVAQEEDDSWTVIDGLQRLNTLKRYFERDFKLSGLEVLQELNRSDIKSLNPKALRMLKNGLIRVIVVGADSHPEIKYDVFMRLNRGSVKLNEQELRNCLYRGTLNEAIKDFCKNENYLAFMNLTEPHKRMVDAELILRFIALSRNWGTKNGEVENYKGQMKVFLNEFMNRNKSADEDRIEEYRTLFETTTAKVYSVFGNKAFKRINEKGEYETALNRAIMDSLMVVFSKIDSEKLESKKEEIKEHFRLLVTVDNEFRNSVTIGTSDVKVLNYRLTRWYNEVNEIINAR